MVGIPLLSIAAGGFGKDKVNVFLMGFFRDLARIKANNRRKMQNSNAVATIDGFEVTTWDILFGRDDPLEGINFLHECTNDAGNDTGNDAGNNTECSDSSMTQTTFTAKELQEFGSGKDGNPIYLSIFGRVYDVSKGEKFYGPNSKYGMFAGKDVTRALCLGCMAPDCLVRSTEGLSEGQIEEGKRWLSFFHTHDKYHYVGSMETLDSEAWLDALIEDTIIEDTIEQMVDANQTAQ